MNSCTANNTALAAVLALIASIALVGFAQGAQKRATGHPRLFTTAAGLAELRRKVAAEAWRARLLERVKRKADSGNNVAAAIYGAIAQDKQYGERARKHLLQSARRFDPGRPDAKYPWGPSAADAIAYDFAAPIMSDEERQVVEDYLRRLALVAIEYHGKTICGGWRSLPSSITRATRSRRTCRSCATGASV